MYFPNFRFPGGSLFSSLPKEILPVDPLRDLIFPKEDKKKNAAASAPAPATPAQSLAPINPQDPLDVDGVRARRRRSRLAASAKVGGGTLGNSGSGSFR